MASDDQNFAAGSVDLLKIMMLTGAAIGIFSVFQLWFLDNYTFLPFEYTGFDFFMRNQPYPESGYFMYMPLVVLIAAAAAVIPALSTFVKREKEGAIAGASLGMVMLAAVVLYVTYPLTRLRFSNAAMIMEADIKLIDYIDAGVYSAITASVLLIVGGIVILLHRMAASRSKKEE